MTDPAPPGPCADPPPANEGGIAELAAGFIHEIKNHLGTLSLNLQLLAEDFEDAQSPRERKALERVSRLSGECRKLLDLSNDFLRFARLRELHTRPAALGAVVDAVIDFLGPVAKARGVEIKWFSAPELPLVCLDCDLFEQALLNLGLNAFDAMPDGGTLTLIGRSGGRSDDASVKGDEGCGAGARTVCLDVIDTGAGIEPAALAKLFRPFHTTKPDGNGLGLATTRKIVVAHGGTIEAQSAPGHGTRFTIALPAAPGAERITAPGA
ncbi:Sensor protein ZraS [Gemmata obscuriglobus]|uniref:histidine kinase n=1 Tax=Gemmata obscuriglobus TaxID=114 RepID=A0A2Z3H378_9BACT|nr:ATP-binding protein [Gemmata obscuriglobus]AWM39311.1 two-component sensor histidine kinase [Gemmata obscuriglobus]QEG27626.1 Sensor protein ZraS [Gemmata obscuriglobus]VTS04775.1 histidine kinase : Histidine kinase OS=uncultured planctomycete GN=HGMM_F12C05C13 PE=4 SV=1: HisKA: HATPase_c [Gemmata obscuriglobus UQM 2246]